NYVVKLSKDGVVTALDRQGQQVWKQDLRAPADKAGRVVVRGQGVAGAPAGGLAGPHLRAGQGVWVQAGTRARALGGRRDDALTLAGGNGREVIDLPTGKLIEAVRFKP